MKKIYNAPTMLSIKLCTVNIMATSEYSKSGFSSSAGTGSSGDEIEVKRINDTSLWDVEW